MKILSTILAVATVFGSAFAAPPGVTFYEPIQFLALPEVLSGSFGSRLAFDEGTLIVGDPDQASGGGAFDGAAFAYRLGESGWVLEESFFEEDLREVGQAVAISGNTAVISAVSRSVPVDITLPSGEVVVGSRNVFGEVLVYTRANDGSWAGPDRLLPANSEDAVFGGSVAIVGDSIAMTNRELGSETWRVTLFERNSGVWMEVQTLEDPEDRRGGLGGGSSSSDSGGLAFAGENSLVIGSLFFGNQRADVFVKGEDGVWEFQQELEPAEEPRFRNDFGSVIAAAPGLVAVGNPGEDEVYTFRKTEEGAWGAGVRVEPVDADGGDSFGNSISISNECLAVGAPSEDSAGSLNNRNATDNSLDGSGVVYLFEPAESGDAWEQVQFLKTPSNDEAGTAVAVDSDSGTVFIGSQSDVFVQVPGPERDYVELEVAVFSTDLDSPIAGPAIFGFAEPFPIDLSVVSVIMTPTTISVETSRNGTFNTGECACVRVRDIFGRLPDIEGFTLIDNTGIPDLTEDHISFTGDEFIINPSGLSFTAGAVTVRLDIAPAAQKPQVTSIERIPDGVRITFLGTPGITDWEFTGGAGLSSFSSDDITLESLAEPSTGSYRADLQISGIPERFFLRVSE